MEMLSLATITRVDPTYEAGRIHRTKGALIFHSEAERSAWLWAVEEWTLKERADLDAKRLAMAVGAGTVAAVEQALTA